MKTNVSKLEINTKKKDTIKKTIVLAIVERVDFADRMVWFRYNNEPAYCTFDDLGSLSYADIQIVFKPFSFHKLWLVKYNDEFDNYKLNYKSVHPETMSNSRLRIVETINGVKTLKTKLNNFLERDQNEENSDNLIE